MIAPGLGRTSVLWMHVQVFCQSELRLQKLSGCADLLRISGVPHKDVRSQPADTRHMEFILNERRGRVPPTV